uniref:Histone-lysine N-methyltransferase, H3 lysine-79 specific n=1 Tax=Corethron hystrix TaxID=216773 RepID=A0A6U5ME90_9STRA|mmetsp:Transcript_9673/g.21489  ORF Transcript_9673/g.21489 Transcript_9673/m.21489 type:complete len:543 (+) Transcript_9673:483-2111(+)|eukprot:CAMPEP_0113297894 /NCGR_PEP_ID=MMETSP0010_2-20120614/566_1 /TAXON_ID=216773 ORGANISM="Corethron hystrix, Strain 308" /NCGR_SAMPLE_ID=MMETSP0010_2 /ASSEMBLY_ACC=CAM_ASM_000155 /LENGTH=542 /DNA_ID=CAMNT_0000150859 /DNA_START=194 /DNA_END=1822 /DNA_ORIENTATION=+ /assembly_acc=CAM_ASM_000155
MPFRAVGSPQRDAVKPTSQDIHQAVSPKVLVTHQSDPKPLQSFDSYNNSSFGAEYEKNIYSRPRKRLLTCSLGIHDAPPSHSHGTRFSTMMRKRFERISEDDSSLSTASLSDTAGDGDSEESIIVLLPMPTLPRMLNKPPSPSPCGPPSPFSNPPFPPFGSPPSPPLSNLLSPPLNNSLSPPLNNLPSPLLSNPPSPPLTRSRDASLSFSNFSKVISNLAINAGYKTICEIDNSGTVKEGNGRVIASFQNRAQYGRFLPQATEEIFKVIGLDRDKTFLDIGSGIGLVVFQAAMTRGCKSRGLELMEGRMKVAKNLHSKLKESILQVDSAVDANKIQNLVELRNGDLTDPVHVDFLTSVDVVFVNNYECIFSARSGGGTKKASLDDHIAALFTRMPVGCQCITLEPLYMLGKSRTEANEARLKRGLEPRNDASFFEYKHLYSALNPDEIVSWGSAGGKQFSYHLYSRVGLPGSQARFLCTNDDCESHKSNSFISAIDEETSCKDIALLRDTCPVCKQTKERPIRRGRGLKKKFEWSCNGEVEV